MGSINRANLPTNYVDFLDESNMVLRLPTPEPQYLFAQMAMSGVLDAAATIAGQTIPRFAETMGNGAMLSPDLDRLVRVSEFLPGAVQFMDVFGKGVGDTFKMNRDIYTSGTYTEASRILSTDATISTTGQVVHNEQVSLTLQEFIGPHDGSSVKPYAVWNFDSVYRAAKENTVSMLTRHLARDYVKWLDTVIRDRMSASTNITFMNGLSSVSSYTVGAGNYINIEGILAAKKSLADREWRPFPNGRYALVVPTSFQVQMVEDGTYRELAKFHTNGKNPIFGYIGSIHDIDIYECSTAKTYAAGASVPNDTTVPASAAAAEALLFGPGVVGWGSATGPEVRFADDTNFGTVDKFIWYAIHAFQTLDSRGVQRIVYQTA